MFDVISSGFKLAKEKLSGQTVLTEENIKGAIEDVRRSLLDADVEYGVVKEFVAKVQQESIGKSVQLKAGSGQGFLRVSAGDHFIQSCHKQLVDLMGDNGEGIKFAVNRPTTIMMVGLQGSGKTTTTGKLANYLVRKFKKKPLLVAADIYRPAAVDQLKVLASKLNLPVHSAENQNPVQICKDAYQKAFELGCDVVIFDTAGRLTIDQALMQELHDIKDIIKPDNTLFVCDAMMGQDAVTSAKAFNDKLEISGSVMTKLDGDARGGAALSIRRITGKPLKFIGIGEGLDRLEEFRADGLASRILNMGDVVGLMEDFDRVAEGDREADMMKMLEGKFSFKDFYDQLSMIQKMGSLKDIMAKLPMQQFLPKDVNLDDGELVKIKAMIDSMTPAERMNPKLFNESRIRRISRGSGTSPNDVSSLIKRFIGMRDMMGMFGKGLGGMLGKIPGMGGLGQLNQMRQMAQAMAGGGMPGFGGGGMPDLFGGMGGGGAAARKPADKDKLKKLRKQAKEARKRNRR
jgi:signal recognition particle subunit SRP54